MFCNIIANYNIKFKFDNFFLLTLNLSLIEIFYSNMFKFAFSNDIINGYWIKRMTIYAVTDLADYHLFSKKR